MITIELIMSVIYIYVNYGGIWLPYACIWFEIVSPLYEIKVYVPTFF